MHMCLHVQTLPTPLFSCLSDGQIKSSSKLLSQKLVENLVHTIKDIRDNLDLGNETGLNDGIDIKEDLNLLAETGWEGL